MGEEQIDGRGHAVTNVAARNMEEAVLDVGEDGHRDNLVLVTLEEEELHRIERLRLLIQLVLRVIVSALVVDEVFRGCEKVRLHLGLTE